MQKTIFVINGKHFLAGVVLFLLGLTANLLLALILTNAPQQSNDVIPSMIVAVSESIELSRNQALNNIEEILQLINTSRRKQGAPLDPHLQADLVAAYLFNHAAVRALQKSRSTFVASLDLENDPAQMELGILDAWADVKSSALLGAAAGEIILSIKSKQSTSQSHTLPL